MGWSAAALPDLTAEDRARLDALPVQTLPRGARLFGPGEQARGFVVVLSGRIEVSLLGPSGREIMLYAVEPGQSCVQTTLGLLGDEPYTAEAEAASDLRLVMIPAALFHTLMARSEPFRAFVFRALAVRMQDMTGLLERVAFTGVEARLAQVLLAMETGGTVTATHAELAARVGSVREVISRRLESMVRRGLVRTDRGRVELRDRAALQRLAETV